MATKFTFKYVPESQFPAFENKDTKALLMKWGLQERISMQTFTFDQPYAEYLKNEFITCFLKDPEVVSNLRMLNHKDEWVPLGRPAHQVEFEELQTTATSMTFFNRLYAFKILREDGSINLCYEEYLDDGTIVSDELRKALMIKESEHYHIFHAEDRSEFLFLIFLHLTFGGKISQSDEKVDAYLEMTKEIYKDFVSVVKDPGTQQVKVISSSFNIKAYNEAHEVYYPGDSKEEDPSYSYITVCPNRRLVKVFYYKYGIGTFCI